MAAANMQPEQLADALRETLDRCREHIEERQARRLSRTITLDDAGRPQYLTFACRLPAGDGGERQVELLRLPWLGLARTETVDVTELAVEIDCRIGKPSRRQAAASAPLTLVPERGGPHRVRVSVGARQEEPSVSIDGETVEAFIAERLAPAPAPPAAKRNQRWLVIGLLLAILGLAVAAWYFLSYD